MHFAINQNERIHKIEIKKWYTASKMVISSQDECTVFENKLLFVDEIASPLFIEKGRIGEKVNTIRCGADFEEDALLRRSKTKLIGYCK